MVELTVWEVLTLAYGPIDFEPMQQLCVGNIWRMLFTSWCPGSEERGEGPGSQ